MRRRVMQADDPHHHLDRRRRHAPPNRLDLERVSALKDALRKCDGAAIVVTHDRELIEDAATRVRAMSKHGADDFNGPRSDFLRKVDEVRLDR